MNLYDGPELLFLYLIAFPLKMYQMIINGAFKKMSPTLLNCHHEYENKKGMQMIIKISFNKHFLFHNKTFENV